MTRLAGKVAVLVVLVCVLAPAAAPAKVIHGPPVAGRNFLGAQIDARLDPYRELNLLSTRVVDDGKGLNVWLLSRPANCAGWAIATRKVPIDAQGHFHADLTFEGSDAPIGTGTVDGKFTDTEHRGTVAFTTIHTRFTGTSPTCDSGIVHLTAISPKHAPKGAGQPKPNALFVGMTKQTSSRIRVKLPVLALISASGTQVKRFVTDTNVKCKPSGRQAGGVFRIKDIDIKDGKFDGLTGYTTGEGTDQKRTLVIRAQGAFGESSLTGSWRTHEIQQDSSGALTDDCDSGDLSYVAARVGRGEPSR